MVLCLYIIYTGVVGIAGPSLLAVISPFPCDIILTCGITYPLGHISHVF